MRNFPDRSLVDSIKRMYPAGARVVLVSMNDSYSAKPAPGDVGTVAFVDDIGTVHVDWDCGSSLGAVYGEDHIRIAD